MNKESFLSNIKLNQTMSIQVLKFTDILNGFFISHAHVCVGYWIGTMKLNKFHTFSSIVSNASIYEMTKSLNCCAKYNASAHLSQCFVDALGFILKAWGWRSVCRASFCIVTLCSSRRRQPQSNRKHIWWLNAEHTHFFSLSSSARAPRLQLL